MKQDRRPLPGAKLPALHEIGDWDYVDQTNDTTADTTLIEHAKQTLLTGLSVTGSPPGTTLETFESLEHKILKATPHKQPLRWMLRTTIPNIPPGPPPTPNPEHWGQISVYTPKDAADADRYVRELNEKNWERLRQEALTASAPVSYPANTTAKGTRNHEA